MDHFVDFHLLPDPELPADVLMGVPSKTYSSFTFVFIMLPSACIKTTC